MSIFNRLTRENENSVTELLVNLLKDNKSLRNVILKFLLPELTDSQLFSISNESFTPQNKDVQNGQQDFIIQSEAVYVIFENKIRNSTDLTDHEINDYIKLLLGKRNQYKKLLFCVPKKYSFMKDIEEIKEAYPDFVRIVLWEDFIQFFYDNELDKINILCNEVVKFFCNVIDLVETETKIKWTAKGVVMAYNSNDLFAALNAASKICEKISSADSEIIEKLNTSCTGCFTPSDFHPTNTISTIPYAKFVNKDNRSDLFYGFWDFEDKEMNNQLSFCVCVHNRIAKPCVQAIHHGEWLYLPLDKKVLFDDEIDAFVNEVVSAFQKLLY